MRVTKKAVREFLDAATLAVCKPTTPVRRKQREGMPDPTYEYRRYKARRRCAEYRMELRIHLLRSL